MKKKERIISFLCAVITMINIFSSFILPTFVYAAQQKNELEIGDSILLVDKGKAGRLICYDDEEIEAHVVTHTLGGEEYPAYCNEPSWQGVGSNGITQGEYIINDKYMDARIWRAVTNGYPYKTPSEMGVNGSREAFMATKQAVYRLLDGESVDKYTSLNPEGENVIAAIKRLVDIGLNGEEQYKAPELTITPDTPEAVLDDLDPKYKSQTFSVEGNCEFDSYEVIYDISDLPLGTKIVSENGVEQTTFKNNEKFKVMIPVNENEVTSFDLSIKADLKSMPLYHAEAENIRLQAMLITSNPYEEISAKVPVKLNKLTTDLTIIKKDSVTNEGLGNAVFRVEKIDGTLIGTYTTDNTGKVVVHLSEGGYYKVIEENPPERVSFGKNK